MKKRNIQQGFATILLVVLLGVTVTVGLAGVHSGLKAKTDAGVAAHAQTNAQMMTWAGVGAFRQYIEKIGSTDVANVIALNNTTKVLKNIDGQSIQASNITLQGCAATSGYCNLRADIQATDSRSKASATLQALYTLTIHNGVVVPATQRVANINLAGAAIGGLKLESEVANTKLNINSKGDLTINPVLTPFEMSSNISEATFNVDGDVFINCLSGCKTPEININATGKVTLLNGGSYNDIHANGDVKIGTGGILKVKAGDVTTQGEVRVEMFSEVNNILAQKVVLLSGADVKGNIKTNGDLIMPLGTKVRGSVLALDDVIVSASYIGGDVAANGKIGLDTGGQVGGNAQAVKEVTMFGFSSIKKNVTSNKHLWMSASEITGNAKVKNYIHMDTGSKIKGSAYAQGNTKTGSPSTPIFMTTSTIEGNAYSTSNIVVLEVWPISPRIKGDAYVSSRIEHGLGGGNNYMADGRVVQKNSSELATLTNFPAVATLPAFNIPAVNVDAGSKVDVRVYKNQANYIFTSGKPRGASRIYLNYLKNRTSNVTYMYENGVQKAYASDGSAVSVDPAGFYLGKYKYNGQEYVGALCEQVALQTSLLYESGECTSAIVGYLPRVSVGVDVDLGFLFGLPQAYGYDPVTDFDWYLRSRGGAKSSPDNANLAPGILYFEGHVEISGDQAFDGSDGNAYTNTILAEGHINAISWSPRIYSPYNILREGDASLICNRTIKTTDGTAVSKTSTTPNAISDKFLVPTNLCKNDNAFSYNMNRDANGDKTTITIDGTDVEKLDLGFVALMSNKTIRVGTCSKIYGDVLAKWRVETSTAGILCSSPAQALTGQVTAQGDGGLLDSLMLDGSMVVVPDVKYTSEGTTVPGTANVDTVQAATVKWSKFL